MCVDYLLNTSGMYFLIYAIGWWLFFPTKKYPPLGLIKAVIFYEVTITLRIVEIVLPFLVHIFIINKVKM